MLKRIFDFGAVVSKFPVAPSLLGLGLDDFRSNPTILGLKAGRLATLGDDGAVRLATSADAKFAGFLVNDVAGYSFENVPAYASGHAPLCLGGGVVETDQVVEDDLSEGDSLYISDDEPGLLTKVAPTVADGEPAPAVYAKVLVGNAGTSSKNVQIQY
jgi:hypothetical protein